MPVVLVVDDELDLLAALNDEGWRVLVASSARAALSAARSCEIDVVLCDLILHGEDGQAVKEAFGRERGLRRVPFVFMTASMLEAQKLSAERVIEKPFRVHEVVAALAGRLPAEPRAL